MNGQLHIPVLCSRGKDTWYLRGRRVVHSTAGKWEASRVPGGNGSLIPHLLKPHPLTCLPLLEMLQNKLGAQPVGTTWRHVCMSWGYGSGGSEAFYALRSRTDRWKFKQRFGRICFQHPESLRTSQAGGILFFGSVPPKRRLGFSGLQNAVSDTAELFIFTYGTHYFNELRKLVACTGIVDC